MKRLMAAGALCLFAAGCGNGWELFRKNMESNQGALVRRVTVYDSRTGAALWQHTGAVYMDPESKPGNVTIICRDEKGNALKNDFIGESLVVTMFEIAP